MSYASYTAVTPSSGANPMANEWYEKDGTVYFRTTDTTVQSGKTYYSKGGGYLVQLGTGNSRYTIPHEFIKAESYSCVWSVTDVDSFVDGDGTLHRDGVLPNRKLKVEFETPDMSDTEFEAVMSMIRSKYLTQTNLSNAYGKTVNLRAWMPEEGAYKEDLCYLTSDVNIPIRYADEKELRYGSVRFAFIGYSTTDAT